MINIFYLLTFIYVTKSIVFEQLELGYFTERGFGDIKKKFNSI